VQFFNIFTFANHKMFGNMCWFSLSKDMGNDGYAPGWAGRRKIVYRKANGCLVATFELS
jgi:hypothetical protein